MAIDHFVIDTNVLVSSVVFKSQRPIAAIKHCFSKGKVFTSSEVLEEYKSTLLADKFDDFVLVETRQTALSIFVNACELVTPLEKIEVCRDADDNKLLELAVAAKAACIVTGDKDLLALNPFRGIAILTPSNFMQRF
jgi:putative PIN family toxin of toxin-antitoxin system